MLRLVTSLAAVAAVFAAAAVLAQPLTIPEQVAMRPNVPVRASSIIELAPRPFEELVGMADLIVQGTVRPTKTYLTPDEQCLLTDHVVSPSRIFKSGQTARSSPDPERIVVQQFGGETRMNGTPVSCTLVNVRVLDPGRSYMLFLVRVSENRYKLADGIGGFAIEARGRIRPVFHPPVRYEDFVGMPLTRFTAKLQSQLQTGGHSAPH